MVALPLAGNYLVVQLVDAVVAPLDLQTVHRALAAAGDFWGQMLSGRLSMLSALSD
jgi:hypothetical protein